MSNFYEALKQYFEDTPREKVLENWAKSAEFDKIGPSVDEFMKHTQAQRSYYNFVHPQAKQNPQEVTTSNYYPKFTSGFLMHLY
jgi:hypothetical protein